MSRHPFRLLPQSGSRSTLGLAVSVILHASLVGFTVYETRVPGHYAKGVSTELVKFLVPPNRTPRHSISQERIEWIRVGIPEGWGVSDVDGERAGNEVAAKPRKGEVGADPELDFKRDKILDELLGNDVVFSALDVDSTVERSPLSGAPLYPAELIDQKLEGDVHTMYIVDTTGHVDSASFRVVSSTHPKFTAAVLEAVPYMRFRPALAGGRPVRQLVEQTFEFRIKPKNVPKPTAFRAAPDGRTLASVADDAVHRPHAASED